MSNSLLTLENVTMQFGGVVAVDDLSLEVEEGRIVALIGPNGAGKTTAFNCVTGVYQPSNGLISFDGKLMVAAHPAGKMKRDYKGANSEKYLNEKIIDPTPDAITKLGIARTFQNIRLWKSMTVFENVLTAKHMRNKQNVFTATFRLDRAEEKRMQQETLELGEFIVEIQKKHNLTIFMIEHHMDLVMRFCDKIYVIDFGKLIAGGTPAEIKNNQRVIDAYLGVAEE